MRLEWCMEESGALEGLQALGPLQALLEEVAQQVLDIEGLAGKYQACVVLTGDEGIRQVNRDQRGIDSATDVLSFPAARFPRGTARDYPKRLHALIDPDTGCRHLGDIVISVERAGEQAEAFGHSFRREMGYLLVHGICHLLGYDHMEEQEKARMRAIEEEAMGRARLPRDPSPEEGQHGQ